VSAAGKPVHRKKAASRKPTRRSAAGGRRWSARVMATSDALDLDRGVFARNDPAAIARSLKRSAESSKRRKSEPYRSAMSMLNFFINRAGSKLPKRRKAVLEKAKVELRRVFHREPRKARARPAH